MACWELEQSLQSLTGDIQFFIQFHFIIFWYVEKALFNSITGGAILSCLLGEKTNSYWPY